MEAVLISVGTELTAGRVQDTNRTWISRELEARGVRTVMGMAVPDSHAAIAAAVLHGLDLDPDLMVVTGGLGPTSDDVTAAGLAAGLELQLQLNPEAERMVAGAVDLDDLEPHQRKQATMPAGAMPLEPVGTAPGFILRSRSVPIIVLPGVPWEMRRMWPRALQTPVLEAALSNAERRLLRSACFYGLGESLVSEAADNAFSGLRQSLDLSICARYREIVLDVSCPAEVGKEVEASLAAIRQELSEWYYSDGEQIEVVTGSMLLERGKTLAVGESCTGGLLGGTITRVSGSSRFFLGGVTAYHNDVKMSLLRVRQEILDNVGAVSEPVAQQLALGVRAKTGADYGIGITGVAGPTGGTEDKPVGLVFICVSSPEGDVVACVNFPGEREDVRAAAVIAALHMLHRKLLDDEDT